MQIVTDYKDLTVEETINRLRDMLSTTQPYRYNDETIVNAINFLENMKARNKYDKRRSNKVVNEYKR